MLKNIVIAFILVSILSVLAFMGELFMEGECAYSGLALDGAEWEQYRAAGSLGFKRVRPVTERSLGQIPKPTRWKFCLCP